MAKLLVISTQHHMLLVASPLVLSGARHPCSLVLMQHTLQSCPCLAVGSTSTACPALAMSKAGQGVTCFQQQGEGSFAEEAYDCTVVGHTKMWRPLLLRMTFFASAAQTCMHAAWYKAGSHLSVW